MLTEIPLPRHAQREHIRRHNLHHHIGGIDARPFLHIPLPEKDSGGNMPSIEEGWIYSEAERGIHGKWRHLGLDFRLRYRQKVLAPCDGDAIASYFSFIIRSKNNKPKLHEGKPVGYGLGYFVQIRADNGQYVHLAHLSEIIDVPFSPPIEDNGDWFPTNHNIPPQEVDKRFVARVQRGQPIGRVGHSGLTWGGPPEYERGSPGPLPLDPSRHGSWDGPHLHLAAAIMPERVKFFRDILDVYLQAQYYKNRIGPEPLFIRNDQGQPVFAG